jgi:TRAP-type C4-dicarboxylate transport system permease small subunit
MPSMHVAQASLTAAAAFRVGKVLGWIATAYALLIFVGSIHFGWHYAIDGMVAVAATVAIWIGSRIVVEKLLGPWPDAGSLQGKGT